MARRLTARPSPSWVGDLGVTERILQNGLKVLILPRRHVPLVHCDLYYPVGSVDEPPGKSGLAHFVEHMLFKGTERFPKGQIDRLAMAGAGHSNAETGEDLTHYWFAFPSDRWEIALDIEADRIRSVKFDPVEVEAERHVILEEWSQHQDSPFGRLDTEHLALSYLRHPYRNPILGWPEDLRRITVEDLRRFYATHYRPDGAVLVLVGDLAPEKALKAIASRFEGIPRGKIERTIPSVDEPRQMGRREFKFVESESVPRGLLGWHTVPIGHKDVPALEVLADLLCIGRRSRLWDLMVHQERIATGVEVWQGAARRGGQFFAQVEGVPGADPAQVERLILEAIEQLADEGPTPEELRRSQNRLEAAWRWEQEDIAGLASGLGHVALWGDWRDWQKEHREAIAVEAEDIRRVAATYLTESNLTVGWSIPRVGPAVKVISFEDRLAAPRPSAPPAPETALPRASLKGDGSTKLQDYKPVKQSLSNGLRVLHETRPGTGVVALELYVDAGQIREERPGLAALTGRLLEEGTERRSADDLAEAIEDVGGSLEVSSTGASLHVRAEDLPSALEWLADLTIRPNFPEDSVRWVKRRMSAELQADRDDPGFAASLLFHSMIYGDHPYARDPRGTARQLAALKRDDVVGHHAKYFRPGNAFLVVVGDFDAKKLIPLVKQHFGAWSGKAAKFPALPDLTRSARPRVRRVVSQGEQVQVVLGHLGIRKNHPDHDALAVLDHIFGSAPGFTDRLSRVLRDELGLVYSVSGGITDSADLEPGTFQVNLSTGPNEVERAIAAVMDEVRKIQAGEFSDRDVDQARRYLAGSWVFDFQTVEQRAERLLIQERYGQPLDEPLLWPERIAKVTPAQVRRAAKEHISPNSLVRVEYGPLRRRGEDAECA